MYELKRPLNELKKNVYGFQDISDSATYTFKVSDLPDKFLLGKNAFKLHLKEDVLVFRSQVYIDIIDSFGNPIYYKVISDNLPNKERIVAVYVYDSTPVGDCEIIIAGRLGHNPKNGDKIPYSNDPSSPDYHGIPNVVWRKVVQINPQESESQVFYSTPPTVTYSEVLKPQYQLSSDNRLVSLYSTASSTATMYSNRGAINTVNDVDRRAGDTKGHIIPQGTSSATFVPITPIGDSNDIAAIYFSNFEVTASMEGGRIYVNNIPYTYPQNAVVTESKVLNYSGSIIRVSDKNTCFVTPSFYQVLNYTDSDGVQRKLVVEGFRNISAFTASYYNQPTITVNSSSYSSFINLEIAGAEPEIGSVKAINVKAKSISKPGQYIDLGTYDVGRKNILLVGTGSYTMTSKGIEPLSLGDFRKLGTPANYWTGSSSLGYGVSFTFDDGLMDGVNFPSTGVLDNVRDYSEMHLRQQYLIPVKKGTEYEFTFDLYYPDYGVLSAPRQLDVFISGSEVEPTTGVTSAVHAPLKSARFGTYIGSADAQKSVRSRPKFYFMSKKDGHVTPRLVNRITGAVFANMQLLVRNEPGYSPNYIALEVPLPNEFSSRTELSIDLEYYNAKNERSNLGTNLYGVVFQGNTPTTGSGGTTTIPPGTVSGSDQLTSSFDNRYERKGTGIVSSSGQIASDISGSFTDVSSSLSKRVYSLEQTTGSLNSFTGSANTRLNSIESVTGSLNTYTGSNNTRLNTIEQTTGSLNNYTGSNNTRLNTIEQTTGSLNTFTGSINTRVLGLESKSGSYATTGSNTFVGNQTITGSVNVTGSIRAVSFTGSFSGSYHGVPTSSAQIKELLPTGTTSGSEQLTSSYDTRYERKGTGVLSGSGQIAPDISGSFTDVSSSLSKRVYSLEQTTGSLNTFTGSINTRLGIIESTTGSLNTTTGSILNRLTSIEQTTGSLNNYTGSNNTRLNTIEQTTGSLNTFTGSINTRVLGLESKSGSYATTGSNTFVGNQTISGSATITGSLSVDRATGSFSGSFHGQYSSSAQVNYDQITNKPNILTPGQYRVLTSDNSTSSSRANPDFLYLSSSNVNRIRQQNMMQTEHAVSSSFWSTNITYVTQSVFTLSGTTNVFLDFPVYKDNESYMPISGTVHNVSCAVKIETHIYAITGTLASPKNQYNWAYIVEYRTLYNPSTFDVTGLSTATSSRNSSSSIGGYGTFYDGRPDLNSWINILGVTYLGDGRMQLRTQITPTGSGTWTAYVGSTCKVMKHEIRI